MLINFNFLTKPLIVYSISLFINVYAYDDSDIRIKKTTHNPSASKIGDPMTITWSIVPDGTKMPNNSTPSGIKLKSDFINRLDELFGVTQEEKTTDLTLRAWFKILENAFDKYTSKTGLTYIYEPNDNGSTLKFTSTAGKKNVLGDIRIGGLTLDTAKGSRAYSGYPGSSGYAPNIVFNTAHPLFHLAASIDFLLVHENMHNTGSHHVMVNSNPTLTAAAMMGMGSGKGPQFDDLLSLHRRYGDLHEKNGGNDTVNTATYLGNINDKQQLKIGGDAGPLIVKIKQTDFVSIDGKSDTDIYKFTISESIPIQIRLKPKGPIYEYLLEDSSRTPIKIDASKLNDLSFTISNSHGLRVDIDQTKKGEEELFKTKPAAGEYYIEVNGRSDKPQFYSLEISIE